MKKRGNILLILFASMVVLGSVVSSHRRSLFLAYANHRVRAVTSSLPECDRVEVFHIEGEGSGDALSGFLVGGDSYSRILSRKVLTGADAVGLAELWRSQIFGFEHQGLCHRPAYGLRFYRGSSLEFETSLCFHCSNFYVTVMGEAVTWGFDSDTPKATNFLARMQQIFPASIPTPRAK